MNIVLIEKDKDRPEDIWYGDEYEIEHLSIVKWYYTILKKKLKPKFEFEKFLQILSLKLVFEESCPNVNKIKSLLRKLSIDSYGSVVLSNSKNIFIEKLTDKIILITFQMTSNTIERGIYRYSEICKGSEKEFATDFSMASGAVECIVSVRADDSYNNKCSLRYNITGCSEKIRK